tara:strand:- start:2027 stop:2224 length:198 start_codon:yes stop_codon:yes gene_type:complete
MSHPDLEYLENLLSKHDWYFEYSDDRRVWSRGCVEAEEIRRQTDICCGLGLSEEAKMLIEKYGPG